MNDKPILVPDGDYVLRFVFYETKRIFRTEKLYLHFQIMTLGRYFEAPITRHYNCSLIGKPGRNGKFRAGWKSDLMREVVGLTGLAPKRNDRLNINQLAPHLILGRVESVKTSNAQCAIPELLRYSVVRRLCKIYEGAIP